MLEGGRPQVWTEDGRLEAWTEEGGSPQRQVVDCHSGGGVLAERETTCFETEEVLVFFNVVVMQQEQHHGGGNRQRHVDVSWTRNEREGMLQRWQYIRVQRGLCHSFYHSISLPLRVGGGKSPPALCSGV